MKRPIGSLLLAALTCWACAPGQQPPSGPHVILVTVESLRTDHVGAYGGASVSRPDVPITPNLDAFAAGATVYEDAQSVTSWTLASHASLFTGLYPAAHQTEGPRDCLDDSYPTLAEALADAGWQTAGVVSGPYLRPTHNLDQGFQLYDDDPASLVDSLAHDDVTNPKMERGLRRIVEEQRDPARPLFLFAYFWDPHFDYIPPAPYDTMFVGPGDVPIEARGFDTNPAIRPGMDPAQLRWLMAQYAGEIRWTDEHLGRFFALLQREGLWDDALVIVTADHGEEFFDHGAKGHKNNLHVETVHVPLIVKFPGQREGRREKRLVSLVDVVPTVLDVAGVSADFPVQGRSLRAEPEPRPVVLDLLSVFFYRGSDGELFSREARFRGLREGSYKLLWTDGAAEQGGLYDVARDPGERAALGAGEEARRVALRAAYDESQAESRRIASRYRRCGEAHLSAEEIEQLRELGYLSP